MKNIDNGIECIYYENIERRKLSKEAFIMETKRERFVRLAEARTNKILEMMRLLGNCSSKANYDYTEEDVREIFSVLEKELKNTKNRFMGVETKEEKFRLKGERR